MILLEALKYTAIIWVIISQIKWLLPKIQKEHWQTYLCPKCITFWITLLITLNLPLAAIAALMAYLIDNYLTNVKL